MPDWIFDVWPKQGHTGPEYDNALDALSNECFEAIKIIERERSGIRDGDGYWHGADVIGGMTDDLTRLCRRVLEAASPAMLTEEEADDLDMLVRLNDR